MNKVLIVVAALALAGCSKLGTNGGTAVQGMGGSSSVQEVTLKDGTRCAVLIGYQKGGIDCGWTQ